MKSPHSREPVNRVKIPPQRGISHLGDHALSIFVASASEWRRASERGQTEEYTRGEGSCGSSPVKRIRSNRKSELLAWYRKDYRCGRGWEIALVSSHRAVTTLRNNENSVRLVRWALLWHLWQPLTNMCREIPEARDALCTRVSLSSFHLFVVCFGFAPFATRSRSPFLLDLLTPVDLRSHYPTRRDLFELIRAILPLPAFPVHALWF